MPIPLATNPNVAILNPGDKVVISVASKEWETAELAWEAFSADEGLTLPGELSPSTGSVVVYQAPPEGSGTVTVSVIGRTKDTVGSASISFSIQSRPLEAVVDFWTFPAIADFDSKRASEFSEVYKDSLVLATSISQDDIRTSLSTAVAAGEPPVVVRFPDIEDVRVFGENGLLDADAATRIIRKIGEDKFNEKLLDALVDPTDKTRWLAIPTEQGALSIMIGAANKSIAEVWVAFLVERELEGLRWTPLSRHQRYHS